MCSSDLRILQIGVLIILAFQGAQTRAERILVRGRRGPIFVDRGGSFRGFPRRAFSLNRRLSPNVAVIDGRVMEIDRFNRARPLFVSRADGTLMNSVEPDTANQLAGDDAVLKGL